MRLYLLVLTFVLSSCGTSHYFFNGGAGQSNIDVRYDATRTELKGNNVHLGISEETAYVLSQVNFQHGSFEGGGLRGKQTGWEAALAINIPYIKPRYIFGNTELKFKDDNSLDRSVRFNGWGVMLDLPINKKTYLYFIYDSYSRSQLVKIQGLQSSFDADFQRFTLGFRYYFATFRGLFNSSPSRERRTRARY